MSLAPVAVRQRRDLLKDLTLGLTTFDLVQPCLTIFWMNQNSEKKAKIILDETSNTHVNTPVVLFFG